MFLPPNHKNTHIQIVYARIGVLPRWFASIFYKGIKGFGGLGVFSDGALRRARRGAGGEECAA